MTARLIRFNIYFLLIAMLAFCFGCQTEAHKKKKAVATLSLHMEVGAYEQEASDVISVLRDHPFDIRVLREAFLNEADVAEARIIDANGGFAISIRFDRRGQWLLEQYTAVNRGKRIAIECAFGPKLEEKRWIAAPVIQRRIADGVLTFTPDASREEAKEIVLGLNNVAKRVQDKSNIF